MNDSFIRVKGEKDMKSQEWRYLKQHPALWRILLGILVIPLFYAALFLASVWNPYGEMHRLPMAVVNQDRGTQTLHWGQTVSRELVDGKSLQFHQMAATKAQRELKAGQLFLVLKIPANASKTLRHLATAPRQLQLTYDTNAGQSTVAAKMGATAMQKLQEKLNQSAIQAELQASQKSAVSAGQQLKVTASQHAQVSQASLLGLPATQVAVATQKIATGLAKHSQQLSAPRRADQLKQLAMPVKLTQHDVVAVANNGTGMAPYFMAISLFVGCITLNIIYDARKRHGNYRNFVYAWLDKMGLLWGFVVLAASCMWLGVRYIIGLRPLEPGKTYLLSLLIVLAFFSLVTCFRLWFGLTGAWLMLLFMLFQIGASGGTYPIELTNPFYRAVHPYLPMTVAMAGLRHTISLGGSIAGISWILVGIVVGFSLGTLAYFYWHRADVPEL
ncbi:YhgE/Pip domain-containing protein [Levilactobacillus tongjiangensis]|uniref:YhgE/Pip domain-containing protein n=1 Tax=Levilactobacillus tongjiangensis TaxID=2486023 RepID=A0ABW1SQZ2_9LACO|nr:YhgE/Pip family protein [Levilactobacillus tongjiangensis]